MLDNQTMETAKDSRGELHKRLFSFGEEFQRDMVTLITSYSDKISKDMIKMADEVSDLQEKHSATTETCNQLFVKVNEFVG